MTQDELKRNQQSDERERSTLDGGLLVIKASAGSGKTYTLSRLYIELLLFEPGADGLLHLRKTGDYHHHILAITFTNKATDEMKHRIVAELHQLATDPKQSKYHSYFKKYCTPEAFVGMKQAAQSALTSILMNYSSMNVSTIDSFFQKVMRNFARELDRDYNYEIQVDGDFAVRSAVNAFLTSLGNDASRMDTASGNDKRTTVEAWVRDFISSNVEQDMRWNFYADERLVDLAKKMEDELFRSRMADIRNYLSRTDSYGNQRSDLSKIHRFKQCLTHARDYYKERYTTHFLTAFRDVMARHGITDDDLNGNQPLKSFILANKMKEGKKNSTIANRKSAIYKVDDSTISKNFLKHHEPCDEAKAEIVQLVNDLIACFDRWQMLESMISSVGLLGLLGEIDLKLEQYRKDNNVVLIADTNDLINMLVRGDNAVPFIYERVGTWINHFMIDEFQDTSHKQYENFYPLLCESLSQGRSKPFSLLIGDSKQSIYRFRNADPTLFRDKVNTDFATKGLRLSNLPTNFRSLNQVVTFNNLLFEQLVEHYVGKDTVPREQSVVYRTFIPSGQPSDYQQIIHKLGVDADSGEPYPEGCVRVLTKAAGGDPLTTELMLEELPAYLLELHKRFTWSQMGILVNRHNEGIDVVQSILEHNKAHADQPIRVTSDEAMQLSNSPSVRRIVSMLRFVDMVQYHVDDSDADDAITTSSACGDDDMAQRIAKKRLSDQRYLHVLADFVAKIARQGDTEAAEAGRILDECFKGHDSQVGRSRDEKLKAYAQELGELLPDPRTHLLTLTTIVECIIERVILADGSPGRETAYLLAFQSMVADFVNRSGGTVREFLRFWDQKCDKLTMASATGEDAITVLTIHKSKGLEFDCVIIPYACWDVSDNSSDKQYWLQDTEWTSEGCDALLSGVPGVNFTPDLLPPLLPIDKSKANYLAEREGMFKRLIKRQTDDALIDNLNKTYVAFTRPRNELHIFAFKANPNRSSSIEHIDELLMLLMPQVAGATDFEGRGWQMGSPVPPKKSASKSETLEMPPYYVTPSPGVVQVKLPHDTTTQKDQGLQLHNLMGRIRYQRDARRAVERGRRRGVFTGAWTQQQFEQALHHLFTDSATAPWYADDATVYNERNLVVLLDDTKRRPDDTKRPDRVVYRPDRVVRRPDGTLVVIDYKFGVEQPGYASQVRNYADLLADITGTSVEQHLVYLLPGHTPKVVDLGTVQPTQSTQ